MLNAGALILISLCYLALLFILAFVAIRRAQRGAYGLINTPVVYTLSLAVYCTSWTFYGAVGSASRSGYEFFTIYLGPTLVFIGWWFVLRKLVRISKTHRITSIADFISSRYGKSARLAALVTVMAVIGTTPYIALQLKAVATSFHVLSSASQATVSEATYTDSGFWVAAAMGVFIVLFGTRNIGADEHHPGVVAAIAFESLVKLFALVAVGLFVIFHLTPGDIGSVFKALQTDPQVQETFSLREGYGARWFTLMVLSAAAIICLPRQFQITVVEISNEANLKTASWLFPLYLLLISLFVIPIALAGMTTMPAGSDPDLFVLTVPMNAGQETLAILAFIGGFSSATSMMIVASIALSIMVSNHLVMPLLLRTPGMSRNSSGELTRLLLNIRRTSIIAILFLGYVYYRYSARSDALASIGLISFAAVAQFLPVIIGGIFWRNSTERGAIAGLTAGFAVWAFTLLVPALERAGDFGSLDLIANGLWGNPLLRPEALFGLEGWDPLVHALFWSYLANISFYIIGSLLFAPKVLEQVQAALFVNAFTHRSDGYSPMWRRSASVNDLLTLTQRIIGRERTQSLFQDYARSQKNETGPLEASEELIAAVERQLASTVGAASARVMVSRVAVGEAISLDEMIEIVDEAQQVIEYSRRLEQKSAELEETAAQLGIANEQLTRMDKMKDDFLSLVSHELRTPMTSIRSFSEILLETKDLDNAQSSRFLNIIVSESQRLTRLLDEILDISQLESGHGSWVEETFDPGEILRETVETMRGIARNKGVGIIEKIRTGDVTIAGDRDRLKQVYINILSNSIKYNDNASPVVNVSTKIGNGAFAAAFADNGPGIPDADKQRIFSKFERRWQSTTGSGLGLSICKQIVGRLGGEISVTSRPGRGATFTVTLPVAKAMPPQESA